MFAGNLPQADSSPRTTPCPTPIEILCSVGVPRGFPGAVIPFGQVEAVESEFVRSGALPVAVGALGKEALFGASGQAPRGCGFADEDVRALDLSS